MSDFILAISLQRLQYNKIMSPTPHRRVWFFLVLLGVLSFSLYFSFYTIKRYQKGYAHYFDLGIMHQTVYNTFKSLKNGQGERFLELTDPHATTLQVKRMSIHNDIFLAFLAPTYFLHAGPETLLVAQSVAAATGAWFIFFIVRFLLRGQLQRDMWGCLLAYMYLLYPPLQRAVTYEFHAVVFAIPLLLGMHYAWLKKHYKTALVAGLVAITTKEQVGFTVGLWAMLMLVRTLSWQEILAFFKNRAKLQSFLSQPSTITALALCIISLSWALLSFYLFIPTYRGEGHFANAYYSYLNEGGLSFFKGVWRESNGVLLLALMAPLAFLPILSPMVLFAAITEWAVVMLSLNENMQNIYFHYHAVLIPFLFVGAVESIYTLLKFGKRDGVRQLVYGILLVCSIAGSYWWSAMPWAKDPDLYPWKGNYAYQKDVDLWQQRLSDDLVPVSTSGHLAPFYSGRRYFYDFAGPYDKAQYIVLDIQDVLHGYHKEYMRSSYSALLKDWRYVKVYSNNQFEVYRRVKR